MELTTEMMSKAGVPAEMTQDGKPAEQVQVRVKMFDPSGSWTWYVTEYDYQRQECFGLVVGFEEELGYFHLPELNAITGAFGLGIEQDLHWDPKTTLAQVKSGERR